MQFVNIARDLVWDSESWGRCYFPVEFMDNKNEDIRIICKEKNSRALGNEKLHRYANKMFKLANKHHKESVDAIECLPLDLKGLTLTSIEVYRGIIDAVQSSPTFPDKAKVSRWNKYKIILRVLYIESLQYLI